MITIDNFSVKIGNGFESKGTIEIRRDLDEKIILTRKKLAATGETPEKSIEAFTDKIRVVSEKYGEEINWEQVNGFFKSLLNFKL